MAPGILLEILREAIKTILIMVAPILGFSLLVGLTVSIFQAMTQIQEQTLAFVPKIVAVLLVLILLGAGSWIWRRAYCQALERGIGSIFKRFL